MRDILIRFSDEIETLGSIKLCSCVKDISGLDVSSVTPFFLILGFMKF